MLEELHLFSVGGVAQAHLVLKNGLVVITGESGAGKSSLVRALELLTGKRAQNSAIKADSETAAVEGFFFVNSPVSNLSEDLQPQESSLCIHRELSKNGRGKCSIQGKSVPLLRLSEISAELLSIQSQFAQLELLEPGQQLRILDACGGFELLETRRKLEEIFHQLLTDERNLRKVKLHEQQVLDTYKDADELSTFIRQSKLDPDSENILSKEYSQADDELRRCRELRHRYRLLRDTETGGLIDEIRHLFTGIGEFLSSDFRDDAGEKIELVCSNLDDLADIIEQSASQERIDELETILEDSESKLGKIRKYKRLAEVKTLPELFQFEKKAQEELQWLISAQKEESNQKTRIADNRKILSIQAHKLRELRTVAAKRLQSLVTENLKDLAMESTRFIVKINESNQLRASGAEGIEFMLLRGEDVQVPVAKAASGGELSRILLAIQLSLPDELMPATIAFDEVEAGLGGRSAYLTGLKLRSLANHIQVLLITHEASIAALGDQHFLVERQGDTSTVSEIHGEQRVRELARMLSGNPDSKEARNHARELLRNAEESRKKADPAIPGIDEPNIVV